MVRTRLEIGGTDYAIVTDIPVSTNFVQADVREPEKRNASFSKTVQLYGTNAINLLFENIFEVNTVTGYFNVNTKTPAKYFIDDVLNFKGDLQLLKITTKPDNNIVYDIIIIGQEGSLFVDIGDAELDALDFSAYNHAYTRANQRASWSNAGTGSGYYYGFIHRGLNGGSDTSFGVRDFIPQFFVREYLEKIFTLHGYTWTSSTLDSTEFKSLVVEPNMSTVLISQSQLNNRQFYVGLTTDVNMTINAPFVNVNFNNETGSFFDVGTQVNGTYAELNDSGYYNLAALNYYKVSFTHSDPSVVKCTVGFQTMHSIEKSGNGGANYFSLTNNVIDFKTTNNTLGDTDAFLGKSLATSTDYFFNNQLATGEMFLTGGDRIRTKSYLGYASGGVPVYYDASNNIVSTGTATWTLKLLSGTSKTSFYALATKRDLFDGNTIEVNNALPKKIKQKDFVKSIMQMYNLYIDYDRNNPKQLTIESYPNYFNDGIVDWENKVDYDKDIVISPVSLVDAKKYTYTYKEDKDYYNTKYKESYDENFGAEIVDIQNDFQKAEKKNEIIFSPTPNVANYGLGIAMPKIFKEDPNISIKPITPNIRILYAGGTKQTFNPYTYKEFNQTDLVTYDYGYCGHVDDPQTPTIDINFGTPLEVYYNLIGASFTNNNLYNRFHKPFVFNNTSRDSKVVTAWLYLTPNDIYNFSFRKKYFIVINDSGAYYIVNKIINYNPMVQTSTQCELIKVLEAELFTPESTMIDGGLIPSGGDVAIPTDNSSLRLGTNTTVLGTNNVGIGNNIFIPESASNITVIGNNVTIAEKLTNVSVINSSDLNITKSNVNYLNNVLISVWNNLYSSILKITASGGMGFILNMDETHSTVLCDCTLNTVDIYLPNPSTVFTTDLEGMGTSKIYTILKIDAVAKNVSINPYASETINGASSKQLTTQYETIRLQTDGVNWFVIN